jgi:hypothetical protein
MINSYMKIKDFLLENMTTHLLDVCKHELELNELPPIELVNTPTVGSDHSFGVFDGGSVKVVAANRHPIDVMRTLAHELVHWKQRTENQQMDGETGSETENQANAIAGIIMRNFGEMYPEYFLDTLP